MCVRENRVILYVCEREERYIVCVRERRERYCMWRERIEKSNVCV